MEGLNIGRDLLIVLATAIAGGMLARWLRLPIILGYLLGGIAVGPYGLGWVHETQSIDSLANIGVILLLFAIGLEFSLKDVLRLGKVTILGGLAQIVLTTAAGLGLGWLLGLGMTGSVLFGFLIALSSTMVVLKILIDKGELDTIHGRILLGILLVQDLSVVPVMIIIPSLADGGGGLWAALGIALLKAVLFLGVMLALGVWGLPWFLRRVAGQRTRELFLLTVVVLCLAAAFGTYSFGLSAAFGAFAAGLLISQSGFARQAFADILPMRDTFSALFFVSLGMVANLHFVGSNLSTVVVAVAVILATKFIISSAITRLFGYSHKTVLMVGTGLVQIGEFSFVLAMMGVSEGIISESLYALVVAVAVITMLLTPFLMSLSSAAYRWFSQRPWSARILAGWTDPDLTARAQGMSHHAVICGYGDIGRRVAEVLERRKFFYLVIDLDPQIVARLHARGIPCIYGDASNPDILAHAGLDKARVLVCAIPDLVAVELTTRNALRINPKLDIVARVHRDADAELLKNLGVAEVVLPLYEGSLEVIRHTLHRFGMSSTEIQYILNGLRSRETKE